jgi:hypothetical protein
MCSYFGELYTEVLNVRNMVNDEPDIVEIPLVIVARFKIEYNLVEGVA